MQDIWLESSSENSVNLMKQFTTIPAISNFSEGIIIFWRTMYMAMVTDTELSVAIMTGIWKQIISYHTCASLIKWLSVFASTTESEAMALWRYTIHILLLLLLFFFGPPAQSLRH